MKNKYLWWKNFFPGFFYDLQKTLWTKEQTKAQADFLQKVLDLSKESETLDAPCGDGRLAIELAGRGFRIAGIDFCKKALRDAKAKSAGLNLNIEFKESDLRKIPWKGRFDSAFCFWGSFGYFDEKGNLESLKSISKSLKPNGNLLIDTFIAETILHNFGARSSGKSKNLTFYEERKYNFEESRIECVWTIKRENQLIANRKSSIRVYTYKELVGLLRIAGFSRFKSYGSLNFEPLELGKRLYLIANK